MAMSMKGTTMTMKNNDSPILGLGTDIIEIERMRTSIHRHGLHFLNRLFSQREQDYCYKYQDPSPHFAGRFAAKEAIAKAFGTGFGAHLSWHDIEILNDEHGKPTVSFSLTIKQKYNNPNILVAISHSSSHANAVAIWQS